MSFDNVLYEPPGPIARRRNRIISAFGAILLLAGLMAVGLRLDESGQFDAKRWEIFLHPGTLRFLFDGLVATLVAAVISMILAFSLAVPLALQLVLRISPTPHRGSTSIRLWPCRLSSAPWLPICC